MLEQVAEDPSLRFKLKEPEQLSPPLLQLIDVTFKYKKRSSKETESKEEEGEESNAKNNNNINNNNGSEAGKQNNAKQTKTESTDKGDLLIVEDCNLNIDMDSRIAVSRTQLKILPFLILSVAAAAMLLFSFLCCCSSFLIPCCVEEE